MADTEGVRRTPVLVTDFDGTMTRRDFYRVVVEELLPPETPDYWEEYLSGRLTHFEALQRIFSTLQADDAALLAAARKMDLDPAVGPALARAQQAGWEVVIASAGCEWYIARLLAENAAYVHLHCNPGALAADKGLVMSLPLNSPYYSPATGIDKEAVVRDAVSTHDVVAFAGDGRPDLPAAMLVPPKRRFARGWLAEHLTAEGVPYVKFDRWSEIIDILLEEQWLC